MKITVKVNGMKYERDIAPHRTLLRFIREDLGLTGTKEGCAAGECGACTVILNGKTVNSCLILAAEVNGAVIETVESEAKGGKLSALQQAFLKHHAVQCGYCTPGMLMSVKALLKENPKPTVHEIKEAIEGNFCRCTGYQQIIEASSLKVALMSSLNRFFLFQFIVPLLLVSVVFFSHLPVMAEEVFTTDRFMMLAGPISLEGHPAPLGTLIEVRDSDQVLCGNFIVDKIGLYGVLNVFADDPNTQVDEGAIPGDKLQIFVNGELLSMTDKERPSWQQDGKLLLLPLQIGRKDELAPFLLAAKRINAQQILITFSESVVKRDVEVSNSWTVTDQTGNPILLSNVRVTDNPATAILTLTTNIPAETLTISARKIHDLAGNSIVSDEESPLLCP
jgi:carbon-monoxide dehydrogenase small subunit